MALFRAAARCNSYNSLPSCPTDLQEIFLALNLNLIVHVYPIRKRYQASAAIFTGLGMATLRFTCLELL